MSRLTDLLIRRATFAIPDTGSAPGVSRRAFAAMIAAALFVRPKKAHAMLARRFDFCDHSTIEDQCHQIENWEFVCSLYDESCDPGLPFPSDPVPCWCSSWVDENQSPPEPYHRMCCDYECSITLADQEGLENGAGPATSIVYCIEASEDYPGLCIEEQRGRVDGQIAKPRYQGNRLG